MVKLIGFAGAVSIVSYLAVLVIRYFAERHAILDVPNERSSHADSVPRGGGLAIVILTLGGIWPYAISSPFIERSSLLAYTIGAGLIVMISWLDDLRSQPNWIRFIIHSVAALLALYAFGYFPISIVLNANPFVARCLGLIITFFWIVGLTNAYNFMDGIDGIAGGQAVVAGFCWAAAGAFSQKPLILVFGLLLGASSFGFLFHNWSPARIFMGDVGSAFLGYSFAVLPLIFISHSNPHQVGLGLVCAAILPVWPFVFDSTFTLLRRLRLGENVFSAHRSHLYQRLVIVGYSHPIVSSLYTGLALVGAFLSLGRILGFRNISVTSAVAFPLLCLALWGFVIRREHGKAGRLRSNPATYADPV
jgi:UDP-N-acetylmuramyl pentapeptide phosphotransferase/UDP-N-acetylglucosamine-1-phosphate transferase